jgi:hypothetical protein
MEFAVDKVALRQVFCKYFSFPCQFSFPQLLHILQLSCHQWYVVLILRALLSDNKIKISPCSICGIFVELQHWNVSFFIKEHAILCSFWYLHLSCDNWQTALKMQKKSLFLKFIYHQENRINPFGWWTAKGLKATVFWDVVSCSLVDIFYQLTRVCCFHLQKPE